jgi:hypothetical protein
MSDPRELLDTYAAQARYYVPLSALSPEGRKGPSRSREDVAPAAFAALRAVLDLHKPEPLTGFVDENGTCSYCKHGEPARRFEREFLVSGGTVKLPMHEHPDPNPHCAECCVVDESEPEPLAAAVPWPCRTVQAVTAALEATDA